jgi:3-phenylpropionate/trans-cinnamate dioxygenase ferredoxin reductase subunit
MGNTLGESAGGWVRGLLEAHDIEVLGGAKLKELKGTEHVESVELEDGTSIKASVVVMGTGVKPDVMLATKAGLEIGELGGVLADSKLKTSADDVYVAGDMAEFESVFHGGAIKRIEHFEVAAAQGRTAARNMLGEDETFDTVPYFWSDIADWATIEYIGAAAAWDDEKLSGSYDDNNFSVEYFNDGKLVAVLSVGGHADLDAAGEKIKAG